MYDRAVYNVNKQ